MLKSLCSRQCLAVVFVFVGTSTCAWAQSSPSVFFNRPALDLGVPPLPKSRLDASGSAVQPTCVTPEAQSITKTVAAPAQVAMEALTVSSDIAGSCVTSSTNLAEDVAAATKAKALKSPALHMKKEDGQPATADDWVAVDLIARTLFGEIAGADDCTSNYAYVKAVGKVMINRADYLNQPGRDTHTKFAKTDTAAKNPVARVAIENSQFQAWGYKGVAPNLTMRCPADQIQKIYRDGSGKVTTSTSQDAYVRWFLALEVATDMVFKEHKFRCSTKEVNALFYAKGNENPIPHGIQDTKAKIDGVKINNPRCAQIWDSPVAKLDPPKLDCK